MRAWITGWLMLAACAPVHSESIAQVLQRSHEVRLESMEPADPAGARAGVVRRSFESLLQSIEPAEPVVLRVVRGGTVAETLRGNVVVVSELLADLPEAERLFILAHELGHVMLGHWSQMGLLFEKWVPGTVSQPKTDAVAALLGREASGLAYAQEFEADAFAATVLHGLGHSQQQTLSVFTHLGSRFDTPTHPGARRRIAALRALGLEAPVRP